MGAAELQRRIERLERSVHDRPVFCGVVRGEYDEEGRIVIPDRIREQLKRGDFVCMPQHGVLLVPPTMSAEEWQERIEKHLERGRPSLPTGGDE